MYHGPKLLGLPKGASEDVANIIKNMDMTGEPDFTDITEGQDLLIGRTGTGFNTKYRVDRTGLKTSLDDLFPEWEEKFIEDVNDALGLKIVTPEEQKAALMFTYGDVIDWEKYADEFGV